MTKYYLEKEEYYWSKVGLDGALLFLSFLIVHYLKSGQFTVHPAYVKFLPFLFVSWFITTIFSKKFMEMKRLGYLDYAKPFLLSGLAFAVLVTIFLYVLGWYFFSRFIIYGAIVLFITLEIIAVLILNRGALNKGDESRIQYHSLLFFLIEFLFLNVAFFGIYFWKRGTFRLADDYKILLVWLYSIWFLISLLYHKFKIARKENYLQTLSPFLFSEFTIIGLTSFFIFFLNLASYSRLVILGTLGVYNIFEILVVSLSYISLLPHVSDETRAAGFHVGVLEDDQAEESPEELRDPGIKYQVPPALITTMPIGEKLEKVFLKKYGKVNDFIQKTLNIDNIDSLESLVFYTANPFNIENLDDNSLSFLMNLREINDFRRINQYFISVNRKLKHGGVFISKYESIEQRKGHIYKNHHMVIAKIIYLFDFIYKRIFPKLPFFKKIYFAISRGRHRVISKTESLGRLHFCGFNIVALREIDDHSYFIAKKVQDPLMDENPSYGFVFKQKRVGKGGEIIYIYKIRTMHPFAEYLHQYIYENHSLGKRGKIHEDYRVTSWGRFFRKFWIDEIPMIYNLFRGDIKLFGVRPLSETFFATYPEDLKKERIKFKPGLIPPYYSDLPHSIEEVWESERRYLSKYLRHPVMTDMIYLFKALRNILFYHAKSA